MRSLLSTVSATYKMLKGMNELSQMKSYFTPQEIEEIRKESPRYRFDLVGFWWGSTERKACEEGVKLVLN